MATVSDHKTLDCPLCFKTFSTPRVLPCSHTFCEKCLSTHIQLQVQGCTKLMCPLCAAPNVFTDTSIATNKWASSFPVNGLVCSVLELSQVFDQVDNKCEPCETDGEATNADVWCINCREYMCRMCEKLHKRNKLMKDHSTVPIDELNQHLQSNLDFDQECGQHHDRVKLFCVDHRKLCCAVCVSEDHCQCNDILSIDEIARSQSQPSSSDYSSIIQDLRNVKIEMEKILKAKKNNAITLVQNKLQILHDMDATINNIIGRLNELRSAFRAEVVQLYKKAEALIQQKEKNIQGFITNIKNSNKILEILEKNGTPQQKFTTFETVRMQIASHYQQLNSQLKDDAEVHLNIETSEDLINIEETLDSIGFVNIAYKPSTSRDVLRDVDNVIKSLNSRTKLSSEMRAAQVQKKDLMTSSVIFVKDVTREKLGRGTWFTGGAYLADGRLMMADYGADKKRLVELDDKYNIVKEYKLDGYPTDVAAGNKDNEIYIAVNEKFIYKCKMHVDLTIVSRIKAPSGTWGIAVSGDNIVVGTSGAVVILTQDGSSVRTISTSGGESYVTVSQTQRTIYHRDNHDVVCRTWEGQEVFRYQHQQLKVPRGIDVDSGKIVYICGIDSCNLHQVSHDGRKSRIIQLQNISSPWGVLVHPQKNEILVTSWNENTVCEVYRLG